MPNAPYNSKDQSVQFLLKIDGSKGQQCPCGERGMTLLLCPSLRTASRGRGTGASGVVSSFKRVG
jgi:hypothetical protein